MFNISYQLEPLKRTCMDGGWISIHIGARPYAMIFDPDGVMDAL